MELERRAVLAGVAFAGAGSRGEARAQSLPTPDPRLWDPAGLPVAEGRSPGPNGPVYWRRYGRPGQRTPVIVLHGGPAAGHRYMRPYAALAHDREVALYDQSGCGASATPADLSMYTVERYVAELEALRASLGWERMALVGHSWGGMLAPAYAAAHPDRVAAMVLAGTAPRWLDFQQAAQTWLKALGREAVATVARAEHGASDDPAYGALLERYYGLHIMRLQPWPAWYAAEGERIGRNPVYLHLNGPSEFQFTGTLAALDLTPQLRSIAAPTLVTCGEFDEAPPPVGRRLAALLPHAQLKVFDGLSHMSHIEDPRRVVGATAAFLDSVA